MRALNDPPPGRHLVPPPALGFVRPSLDPGHHASVPHLISYGLVVIPKIHAQLTPRVWSRRFNHQASERLGNQLHVMSVRRHRHDRQRQALTIGQHTALDATFAAVGGVGSGFFPRAAVPWSCCRPAPSTPNRYIAVFHIQANRISRTPQTRRHRPTPEIGVRCRASTDCSLIQGIPLHARSQHQQDRVHRSAIWNSWPMTSKLMRFWPR